MSAFAQAREVAAFGLELPLAYARTSASRATIATIREKRLRVVLEHRAPADVGLHLEPAHGAAYPPSTTIAEPVVQRDPSPARYE